MRERKEEEERKSTLSYAFTSTVPIRQIDRYPEWQVDCCSTEDILYAHLKPIPSVC
jgi:hypothetical protein